jgi:UDP-2,3-diacylglucosamine pyrophosphatase LpxH
MHFIIVSDLHLGSPYFLHEAFLQFLATLPEESTLVLNGDVIHRPQRPLPIAHSQVLECLRDEAVRRPVVWIWGNHDVDYVDPIPGRITFASQLALGSRLLVMHGHSFDRLSPRLRWCKRLLRGWYQHKLKVGPPAHLLWHAKQWTLLYRFFTRHVRRHAVRWAQAQGVTAIVCGHTHCPEDLQVEGIRYLNTGSWTERAPYYVAVTSEALQLKKALRYPE